LVCANHFSLADALRSEGKKKKAQSAIKRLLFALFRFGIGSDFDGKGFGATHFGGF